MHDHPESPVDIQKKRDATKLRLFDVWSSLAQRYTKPLDEDDLVNIRTGKITTDRGAMRNSRRINFGAIAAPSAEDVIPDDEEDEDECDTDELDTFADTTSRVPPLTGLGLADAEDLRAFLEAERRRKDLCGDGVEEDDYSTDSGSAGTEDLCSFEHNLRTGNDLRAGEVEDLEDARAVLDSTSSEDELNNWDADESNAVYPVFKQGDDDNDSDIEIIEGPIPSPSKSTAMQKLANKSDADKSNVVYPVFKQGDDDNDSDIEIIEGPIPSPSKSTTMQKLANKSQDQLQTSRLLNSSSTSTSNVRMPSSKPYILLTPRKSTSPVKSKTEGRDFTSTPGISGSGSESEAPYRSPNPHSSKPHSPNLHSPNPRRKQRRPPLPPETFVSPLPDPRAQFIITQALQQLSALVDTPWTPPHDSSIPHTPSRRQQSMFNTPTYRPHPYPYFYNPNLSLATLPPESPEVSSPENSSHRPRKSSMARSYSRGKRVSFKIDDDGSGDDDGPDSKKLCSSPSKPPLRRVEAVREQRRQNLTLPSNGKRKARAEAPDSDSSSEDPLNWGSDTENGKSYSRGRTPGPKFGPPKDIKRRQGLSLKG